MALFVPEEPVRCPHGHPLTESVVLLPAGLRQCRWRTHMGQRMRGDQYCPVWMWIWAHQDGSHTVVWVEESERQTIETQRMTPEQVRTYLGLSWPGRRIA